jgi:hypothetical protein
MAGNKKSLPRFPDGKGIILKGKTLNAIFSMLEGWRPRPGRGVKMDETPSGQLIHVDFPPPALPPFYPLLESEEGETTKAYFVRVTPGRVVERLVTKADAGDAVVMHEPANLWEDEATLTLERFAISIGQCIGVKVEVKATGIVGADEGDAVELVVAAPGDFKTERYLPKVEDEEGEPGTYRYKLATLEEGPNGPRWVMEHAGSNIDHYQDLWAVVSDDGEAMIFKKYDKDRGMYITRGLTEGPGILIEEREDDIEIKGKHLGNLNLTIRDFVEDTDGRMEPAGTTPRVHYVRDGQYVGIVDPGDAPADLIEDTAINLLEES